MSNLVEIKYGKGGKFPQVLINGEEISRYMTLSDYIYDDIFQWAERFYDIIDSELAEEYRVRLTGHAYHNVVLAAAKGKSEYCTEVSFEELTYLIPLAEKYRYALRQNKKHGVIAKNVPTGITVRTATPEVFAEMGLADVTFSADAQSDYCIAMAGEELAADGAKYCITVGEEDRSFKKSGVTYLSVKRENLPLLMDYLNVYHVRLSAIDEIFSGLAARAMDQATRLEFEAYSKEEYRVMVQPLPVHMEAGEQHKVKYSVFPSCFAKPTVTVFSDNESVISCKGHTLTAQAQGSCTVRVSCQGVEYATQSIDVSKHNYVTNITLIPDATTMHIGDTMEFRCITSPTDAEDQNELKFSVNNENVAVLNSRSTLYALSAGRVCVTVSTPRVSRRFYVSVLPSVSGLEVSTEHLDLPYGAEAMIYCQILPENASPKPTVKWICSDSSVFVIRGYASNRCHIESVSFGTATLICRLEGTGIEKQIEITTPKRRGCYVATAVYGSYDCPEVWTLRRFRDQYLAKHLLGRAFISAYYAVSPRVVAMFGKTEWFNRFWRARLDKMVKKLQDKGYEQTPYTGD